MQKHSQWYRLCGTFLTCFWRLHESVTSTLNRAEMKVGFGCGLMNVLHRVHRMPRVVHPAVVSRMKMLGRLDIAERRRPQDGRFKTQYRNSEVEIRISTAPTVFGGKTGGPYFDPIVFIQDLDHIGMFSDELASVQTEMLDPTLVYLLVVGQQVLENATTLYSSLNYLSSPVKTSSHSKTPLKWYTSSSTKSPFSPKSKRPLGMPFAPCFVKIQMW